MTRGKKPVIIKLDCSGIPRKKLDDVSDTESEDELPRIMIEKIAPKMFEYDNTEVIVIKDNNGKYWYKGKQIGILLSYADTRKALSRHVDDKYKKTYADLRNEIQQCKKSLADTGGSKNPSSKNNSIKIDPQTIFINESGVMNLVSRSSKPEAEKLWEKITSEIIPKIFETGAYIAPPTEEDIDRLNKSFYDDHLLSEFYGKLVVYLVYIGEYDGKHILKFGKSNNFVKRDLEQHRKMYNKFNVIKIWETLANDIVEEHIKFNFASKQMLISLTKEQLGIKCKEATKRELVVLNEVYSLDYCLNMIDNVVKTTKLPQENQYCEQIKQLKNESEMKDIIHKCKLLETENKYLKNAIIDRDNTISDKNNIISEKDKRLHLLKKYVQDLRQKRKS